jgi:hypothetical protein
MTLKIRARLFWVLALMGTGSEFSRISQHLQQEPWVSTTHSGHLTQLRPPHHSISAMLQRSSARSHGFILSSCQQFTTCGSTTPTAVSLCCSPPKTAISETTLCVCAQRKSTSAKSCHSPESGWLFAKIHKTSITQNWRPEVDHRTPQIIFLPDWASLIDKWAHLRRTSDKAPV